MTKIIKTWEILSLEQSDKTFGSDTVVQEISKKLTAKLLVSYVSPPYPALVYG